MAHGGCDAEGFQRTSNDAGSITEIKLGKVRKVEEVSELKGMIFPDILESRYVAEPVNDFPFPWETEMGSDEDEEFSETIHQNTHRNNHQRRKLE